MSLSTGSADAPQGRGALLYNLSGMTVLILLLAVGFAYLIDQTSRRSGPAEPALGDGEAIIQTIGGQELEIPRSWFRYGEQLQDGFASQADLEFRLDLSPGSPPQKVEVSLVPRSRARASSTLLDRVYLHQFGADNIDGYPGLVGKPMLAQEGYADETVWYDALSPNPFVAKCATAVEGGRPDTCLRPIPLPTGLAAVLKFDATALSGWQRFDAELARWLEKIGAL